MEGEGTGLEQVPHISTVATRPFASVDHLLFSPLGFKANLSLLFFLPANGRKQKHKKQIDMDSVPLAQV